MINDEKLRDLLRTMIRVMCYEKENLLDGLVKKLEAIFEEEEERIGMIDEDEIPYRLDGYMVRNNNRLNTVELVEGYEYQANIMLGGGPDRVRQAAANELFRLRQGMHRKIHELLGEDKCEFCVEEAGSR